MASNQDAGRPLGFGGGAAAPAPTAEPVIESPPNGVDAASGRPYCGRHNVLMVAYSSAERATYYRCPVDGCTEREKIVRPGVKISSTPSYCPRATCAPQKLAMEVDVTGSSVGQLKMICRRCGNVSYVPAPAYAVDYRFRKESVADDFATR